MSIKNSFLAFSIRDWNERLGEMEIIPRLIFIDEQELLEDDDPVMSYMEQEVDEGKQVELDISGVLYRKEDIDNLMQWVEEVNYEPSERDLDIITELENNLNIYSEEDIAKSIDEDIAMESLAAFEGPFDKLKEAIKEKVGLATAKKEIKKEAKRVNNATVTTNSTQIVYDGNEQKIKDDMARGGKAVPTALTDGQLMTYYIDYLRTNKATELVELYALLQEDSAIKATREAALLLSEANLPGEWDKIVTAEGEEELSQEAKNEKESRILKIQQKIQARIKEVKQKGWVIAGYTMDDDLVDKWKKYTSKDTVVDGEKLDLTKPEAIEKLKDKWDVIKKDDALKGKIIDAVIPKIVQQGRTLIKGYLMALETNPFIDWIFKIVLEQAETYKEDIPSEAIGILIKKETELKGYLMEETTGALTIDGLKLSEGRYLGQAIESGDAAQLIIILLVDGTKKYGVNILKNDSKWKSVEEMNKLAKEKLLTAVAGERRLNSAVVRNTNEKYNYYTKEFEKITNGTYAVGTQAHEKAIELGKDSKDAFIYFIEGLIKTDKDFSGLQIWKKG